jgi:uncharacterized protein
LNHVKLNFADKPLTEKDLQPEPDAPNSDPPTLEGGWKTWHKAMPFGMVGAILWLAALTLTQYGVAQAEERGWISVPVGWPDFTYHIGLMALFTVVLVVLWRAKRKPLWSLGFSLKRLPGDLLFTLTAGAIVGALYALAGLGYYAYLHLTHDAPVDAFRVFLRASAFNEPPWLMILGVVVLYPVFEEIWFRGVLYPPMRRELGRPAAIILSSLVFAFAHGTLLPINQFVGGIVFVIAYEYRRTLVAPILLHLLGNGALVVLGWIPWIANA